MLQNEWQSNILVRLYQIMLKIIVLSQIGADRYQKHIFEMILLSPLGELCTIGERILFQSIWYIHTIQDTILTTLRGVKKLVK